MNDLTKHLVSQYLPYLIAFLLGLIVAWKGCGDTSGKPVTTIIEKPVPTIEYVERWKHDTVRFVQWRIKYDTITTEILYERIVHDTLYIVDTLKIVEAWLSEVNKYDTTVNDIRIRWENYQNLSENLRIDYKPKVAGAKFALGVHGNVGLLSDFKTSYTPLMGLGFQATVKKTYFSVDYGFNGQHYVGVRVGRNIVNL